MKKVILKKGREKALLNRHHWIFSGAIASLPDFADGDFLQVFSSAGQLLGSAYFNHRSAITGRMVSFDATPPLEALEKAIDSALTMRAALFRSGETTTAYRLINGEGDALPGLIVDKYGPLCAMQISTQGMDRLRSWLVDLLFHKLSLKTLYEKSTSSSRREEGLGNVEAWVRGEPIKEVAILENGLTFLVDVQEGQKTGFFLDHRQMRQWIESLSKGKRVLNCFCYTGGFSLYALRGGAPRVDSVDLSAAAIAMAKRHVHLNDFSIDRCRFYVCDVFQFLRDNPIDCDLVILDPPAFAKKKQDVIAACRGYKEINRLALQKMAKGTFLLTSSCSSHVDALLFQKVIFQAAVEAGRLVKIIGRHQLAADHPINICHPEGDYLKSLLLYVAN